jgi:hypothetical protein
MNLIISAEYSAPPSEIYAFRALTMYASVFRHYDCLVEVSKGEIDYYYKWMREKYIYDYIKQIVDIGEEDGVYIRYSNDRDRLTLNNLNEYMVLVG